MPLSDPMKAVHPVTEYDLRCSVSVMFNSLISEPFIYGYKIAVEEINVCYGVYGSVICCVRKG